MKTYKIHIYAFIFSIVIFIVGNITVDLYKDNEIQKNKNDLTIKSHLVASYIDNYINGAIGINKTISYITSQNNNLEYVKSIIKDNIQYEQSEFIVDIALNGKVERLYPNKEYEDSYKIDFSDLLKDKNNEFATSVTFSNGEKGFLIKSSIYNDQKKYIGFISCIVKQSEIKKMVDDLLENKYKYKVYYINESNKKTIDIVKNTSDEIREVENIYINFESENWIVEVGRDTLIDNSSLIKMYRAMVAFISFISYITLYLLTKYPLILREQVYEIKEANIKASRSEQKYRSFFDMSPDYVFVINMETGKIIEANKKFREITSFEDIENISVFSLFSKESSILINNMFKSNELKEINLKVLSEKECIELEVNSIILKSKNFPNKILCVGRDLSEKRKLEKIEKEKIEKEKLLEEAIEYNKIKTEFFANMSHELRTPLNVILGSVQLMDFNLNKKNIKDIVKRNNKIIKQNCYRLLRIISNIIDITKYESDYLHMNLTNINIVELIENITMSVVEYAKSKNIDIEFDTNAEEVYINCDEEKIERIILNLLSNAIKFTNKNDKIYVNINNFEDKIKICVKDTGIGIPKESLKVIFERFRQVNKSFVRSHEGSGIGLSLVKSLVEVHGGKIWAESEVGKGSKFYIELPKNYFSYKENEIAVDKVQISEEELGEKVSIEFSDIYFN